MLREPLLEAFAGTPAGRFEAKGRMQHGERLAAQGAFGVGDVPAEDAVEIAFEGGGGHGRRRRRCWASLKAARTVVLLARGQWSVLPAGSGT